VPRTGVIRYSGSKASISGQASLRDSRRPIRQSQARNLARALSPRARTCIARQSYL